MGKKPVIAVIALLLSINSGRAANKNALNLKEYNRTIKGELTLHLEEVTQHTENRNIIRVPVVLHYNLNNLILFRTDAKKYIALFKKKNPSLDITGSSLMPGDRGKRPARQQLYVEEFSRGFEEIGGVRRMVTEKYVRGTVNRGIDFMLTVPALADSVQNNLSAYRFVMILRDVPEAGSAPIGSEGYQKLFIPGMGEQVITKGLHAEFSLDHLSAGGKKEKTKLPELDGKRLVDFLIKPAGFIVFEFRGDKELAPETGGGKVSCYGTLVLKSDIP